MNKDDKMLWIGDLQEDMDADFVAEAFKLMGETTTGVKIVPDKSGQKTAYGFVEFEDGETARRCMFVPDD
jgi:RNA recognition motif-containing protein